MVDDMPLKPGWNGVPGAPKDRPPDDVITDDDGNPRWTDGPHGPVWLTEIEP